MSFFSKKQEVGLEVFCRNFYDNHILYQADDGFDLISIHKDFAKKSLSEADDVFINIDSEKLKNEFTILIFELFSLVWAYKYGDKLAVAQSIFTKKYLLEKERNDIWDGMEKYNNAISHSTTVGMSKVNQASIFRLRADLADIHIANFKKNNIEIDESLGRPINRLFSENAWKKDSTAYFLILALCHQLGLGYGPNYFGPNSRAQDFLASTIKGFYFEIQKYLSNVKIIN
jgi:hypothetical protein